MSLEAELRTKVLANGTVAGLLGEAAGMYAVYAPTDAEAPYVVYRRLPGEGVQSSSGRGPVRATFRLTCWAATHTAAIALGEAVRAAVEHQVGTWGTVTVQHCFVRDESDEFEEMLELLERQLYGRRLDIEIMAAV